MAVYLTESSKKEFNRYILEVLTQIRNFYKLEVYVDPKFEESADPDKQKIFFENKMDEIKLEDYIKHIRAACYKNDANELMFACFKNLQYFDRAQWKKLDAFLL